MRPVLALPVSMMTGLPPEAVRAIIAHELAHIRRHDYLFNLVQMVVEAVLFFNPAVWWLNRQIRIEREACCDALAAGVVGQPLVLAEALSLWAERVHARGVPATAFADTGRHGPRLLLDRVRRMVLPGYRPQVPISPLGLLALLLAGVLALGGSVVRHVGAGGISRQNPHARRTDRANHRGPGGVCPGGNRGRRRQRPGGSLYRGVGHRPHVRRPTAAEKALVLVRFQP